MKKKQYTDMACACKNKAKNPSFAVKKPSKAETKTGMSIPNGRRIVRRQLK